MERLKAIFTLVGLRIVNGGIEVKFLHLEDQVVLRVSKDSKMELGHQYVLTLQPFTEDPAMKKDIS